MKSAGDIIKVKASIRGMVTTGPDHIVGGDMVIYLACTQTILQMLVLSEQRYV